MADGFRDPRNKTKEKGFDSENVHIEKEYMSKLREQEAKIRALEQQLKSKGSASKSESTLDCMGSTSNESLTVEADSNSHPESSQNLSEDKFDKPKPVSTNLNFDISAIKVSNDLAQVLAALKNCNAK